MLPLCLDRGVGVLAYSPLARGRLARPWDQRKATVRGETDTLGNNFYDPNEDVDRVAAERVAALADARGSRTQIAIAWLLHQPAITAPLIGATKLEHL